MKIDIVDSYLYEVTKSLSRKDRKLVTESLRTEILDKIDAVKKDSIETKEEVMSVLKEYGNPTEVAMKYAKDGKKALVPQPYFSHYSTDKVLSYIFGLLSFFGVLAFAHILINPFDIDLELIVDIASSLGIGLFLIYASYTLTFSWVSSSRIKNWRDFSKNLKPMPSNFSKVNSFGIKFQVILSVILLVIFGLAGKFLGVNYQEVVINDEYLILLIIPISIVYFFNVLNIAYAEIDRRYTPGVLGSTTLSSLLTMALAYLVFVINDPFSANFKEWLSTLVPANDLILNLLQNFNILVFFAVIFFSALNIISTAFGFHRNNKDSIEPIYKDIKDVPPKKDEFVLSKDIKKSDENKDKEVERQTSVEKPENEAQDHINQNDIKENQAQDEKLAETKMINKKDFEDVLYKKNPTEKQNIENKSQSIADFMRKNNK